MLLSLGIVLSRPRVRRARPATIAFPTVRQKPAQLLERFRDTFDPEPPHRPWRDWMTTIAERGLEELREASRR